MKPLRHMASRIAVLLTTMGVGTTSMIAQNLPKISIGDLTLRELSILGSLFALVPRYLDSPI